MDQQLKPILAGDAHSVLGVDDLGNGAVEGGADGFLRGLQAAALAQNALAEHGIGNFLHGNGISAERRVDGERLGSLLVLIAAEFSQNGRGKLLVTHRFYLLFSLIEIKSFAFSAVIFLCCNDHTTNQRRL